MVFVFTLSLVLTGCQGVDLFHNLQEIEAEEMLVLLQQNSIQAKKVKEINGQEISWKVTVGEKDMALARQILISNNIPRRRELGLSGVYKEKGLIPTPDEQKARFILALKGEIINSLQKIPGVVDADVVLNIPQEGEFADLDPVKKRPTASVVVRTRNEELVAQTVTEGKLQRFVANTVPNLDPNDVAVIISRSDTGAPMVAPARSPSTPILPPSPPASGPGETPVGEDVTSSLPSGESRDTMVELAGLELSEGSVGRFKAYFIGILSLLVAVSVFLLFNIMRLNRIRLKVQRAAPATAAIGTGEAQGLLGEGQAPGAVEGTFDVSAGQRRG